MRIVACISEGNDLAVCAHLFYKKVVKNRANIIMETVAESRTNKLHLHFNEYYFKVK